MGLVYADIELINADDLTFARRKLLTDSQVKRLNVNAMVDSGAVMDVLIHPVKQMLIVNPEHPSIAQMSMK